MAQSAISAKQRVEKEVLGELINGLNTGAISVETAKEIARETLETVTKIEQHEDTVLDFYRRLSQKHEPFKLLYTKVKGEIMRGREIQAHKDALTAIENGQIAQAHTIAKGALAQTAHETTNNK